MTETMDASMTGMGEGGDKSCNLCHDRQKRQHEGDGEEQQPCGCKRTWVVCASCLCLQVLLLLLLLLFTLWCRVLLLLLLSRWLHVDAVTCGEAGDSLKSSITVRCSPFATNITCTPLLL